MRTVAVLALLGAALRVVGIVPSLSAAQTDVLLLALDFSPGTVDPGEALEQVSWFAMNSGPDVLARPTFEVDLYLSVNPVLGDADDLFIESAEFPYPSWDWPAGAAAQQKLDGVTIPGGISGQYYLFASLRAIPADPRTDNNVTRSPSQLTVPGDPEIVAVTAGAGGVHIAVPTQADKTYILEFKTGLSSLPWIPLTAIIGDGTIGSLTDPSPLDPARFYRISVAGAPQDTGSLQVALAPQGAVDAGARWRRLGTAAWRGSGATEGLLDPGPVDVEFKPVAGWITPTVQQVTIESGQTATAAGTYAPEPGSLQVTLAPQAAIDAGAQWRRVGTATWRASGATETGIAPGVVTVECRTIAGWITPPSQQVTIESLKTATASATYALEPGSLRVTLAPQGAIDAGARWRRVGTATWRASGATETGIAPGAVTVEFKAVALWITPASTQVTIQSGQTATTTGTYTPEPGSLQVTLAPQGAIDAGAEWRRVGTATWRASGAIETGIAPGMVTVEFKAVALWITPANQQVAIQSGQTATAAGTYAPEPGSLRVTLVPQGAIDAGARWRRVGGGAWRASGATETGIAPGVVTVEFKAAVGWITPPTQQVTIESGQTAAATATYKAPPGALIQIPGGAFAMGDPFAEGGTKELPVHTVSVSTFYMERYEVTKELWDEVRAWAVSSGGYVFGSAGSAKALDHPVHSVSWYDVVKWCNARSEKEGLTPVYLMPNGQVYRRGEADVRNVDVLWNASGYRLPTEAEWEKAARGGLAGQRFPWGDTISHSQANYFSSEEFAYDVSPTRGYHPDYAVGSPPFTAPVGSFAPNGYGLYDMSGNVWEWCWDWYDPTWYGQPAASAADPRGPDTGSFRVDRGGVWHHSAAASRCAYRSGGSPVVAAVNYGFRCVRAQP